MGPKESHLMGFVKSLDSAYNDLVDRYPDLMLFETGGGAVSENKKLKVARSKAEVIRTVVSILTLLVSVASLFTLLTTR